MLQQQNTGWKTSSLSSLSIITWLRNPELDKRKTFTMILVKMKGSRRKDSAKIQRSWKDRMKPKVMYMFWDWILSGNFYCFSRKQCTSSASLWVICGCLDIFWLPWSYFIAVLSLRVFKKKSSESHFGRALEAGKTNFLCSRTGTGGDGTRMWMANMESLICLDQVLDRDSADHDGAREPTDA